MGIQIAAGVLKVLHIEDGIHFSFSAGASFRLRLD